MGQEPKNKPKISVVVQFEKGTGLPNRCLGYSRSIAIMGLRPARYRLRSVP